MLSEPHLVSHRRALLGALVLLAVASVLGLASNRLRTRSMALLAPLPDLQEGDLSLMETYHRLQSGNAILLDARGATSYKRSRLPGALLLNTGNFQQRFPQLRPRLSGKELIVYCYSPRCPKADMVRAMLEAQGFRDIQVMRPGFIAWKKERLPLETGTP